MAFQILINLIIAVTWAFLQNSFTASHFFFGYVVGILILFILRKFLIFDFYMDRVWALVKLLFLFFVELVKSNIDVIKIILSPKLKNKTGIVAVETRLDSKLEITLLAGLISLTPGTISMDFSDNGKTIYIHSLDIPDKEKMIEQIHNTFERAIMEVTK
ncbi:Na+/H+ antiporter subunit E [Enterococcus saccharolyticus]|uniref:Na+/H+ antiporter subunit E n=1 Tax=Enterococcus saccharolyticus TaxID=41997 RepID=UPI0039E0DFFC